MKETNKKVQSKSLASKDICDIIKTCAEQKVSLLKFGDLEIWIGETTFQGVSLSPFGELKLAEQHPTIPVTEMTDSEHDKQTKESIEFDELAFREQQIAEFLVTDPEKAEQMMAQGELEDASDESGDVE